MQMLLKIDNIKSRMKDASDALRVIIYIHIYYFTKISRPFLVNSLFSNSNNFKNNFRRQIIGLRYLAMWMKCSSLVI